MVPSSASLVLIFQLLVLRPRPIAQGLKMLQTWQVLHMYIFRPKHILCFRLLRSHFSSFNPWLWINANKPSTFCITGWSLKVVGNVYWCCKDVGVDRKTCCLLGQAVSAVNNSFWSSSHNKNCVMRCFQINLERSFLVVRTLQEIWIF